MAISWSEEPSAPAKPKAKRGRAATGASRKPGDWKKGMPGYISAQAAEREPQKDRLFPDS